MSQTSEIEAICFQRSPCGVLIMDTEGSILQMNEALASMLGFPADRFVGSKLETVQPAAYRTLFQGEGLLQLAGVGVEQERWLFCTGHEEPMRSIKFYQDVTELTKLKQEINALHQQVEDLTITDELTGLANPRALSRALNSQVTRSRRYDNPLCLAIMELIDATNPEATISDDTILATSRHLRDRLRWVDTISRWDHNHFVIILPETNAEDGIDLIGKIGSGFSDVEIPSLRKGHTLELRFGLAQWRKGNDSQMLLERAVQSLNSQREEQLNTAAT